MHIKENMKEMDNPNTFITFISSGTGVSDSSMARITSPANLGWSFVIKVKAHPLLPARPVRPHLKEVVILMVNNIKQEKLLFPKFYDTNTILPLPINK